VERIIQRIAADPEASAAFLASLAFAGWQQHPQHNELVVRIIAIDRYRVGPDFPKLVAATVPHGIEDADYTIILPSKNNDAGGAERVK